MGKTLTYGTFLCGGGGYLPGVIALARSLEGVSACVPLTVFADESLSKSQAVALSEHGVKVTRLEKVPVPDSVAELNRSSGYGYWNKTFSKLRIFSQIEWDKIVLLDADMMVLDNIDELFDAPHMSAVIAGQGGHPDWIDLNSGLMVIEPAEGETERMVRILEELDDERLSRYVAIGDQDVVHLAYPDWPRREKLHLPETYNMFSDALGRYLSEGSVDLSAVRVLHFEQSPKPWAYSGIEWLNVLRRSARFRSLGELKMLLRYRRLYSDL